MGEKRVDPADREYRRHQAVQRQTSPQAEPDRIPEVVKYVPVPRGHHLECSTFVLNFEMAGLAKSLGATDAHTCPAEALACDFCLLREILADVVQDRLDAFDHDRPRACEVLLAPGVDVLEDDLLKVVQRPIQRT